MMGISHYYHFGLKLQLAIAILLTLLSIDSYCHENRHVQDDKSLLYQVVKDFIVSETDRTFFINSRIADRTEGGRILKYYLNNEKKIGKAQRDAPLRRSNLNEIDSSFKFKKQVTIVNDQNKFDSLSYLFWLANSAHAENFIDMPDSTEMMTLKSKIKIAFTTIEFGTIYRSKDLALVSMKLSNSYDYILYRYVKGVWRKVYYILDPK